MRGQEVQFSKEGQHSPIGSMSGAEGDLEIRDRKWGGEQSPVKKRRLVRMEPQTWGGSNKSELNSPSSQT